MLKNTDIIVFLLLLATSGLTACDRMEEATGNAADKAKKAAEELVNQTAEEVKNTTGIDLQKTLDQPEDQANGAKNTPEQDQQQKKATD